MERVVGFEVGIAVDRFGVFSARACFSLAVVTWRVEVFGSLCKVYGCFFGIKSKGSSLGEIVFLISRAEWREVLIFVCCFRKLEKCLNVLVLGGLVDSLVVAW